MSKSDPHTIVNVGYRSTNYWVVSAGTSRVLVDIGWPGTMGQMRASTKRVGVPLNEIRYAIATHYHIDHAGLAQEFKQAGVPLLVVDVQQRAIPLMKAHTKPHDGYLDNGSVFTGDLTHPAMIGEEDSDAVNASWQLLREKGANRVYPEHGPVRSILTGFPARSEPKG